MMSGLNYYWIRYRDFTGAVSQSVVPAHSGYEAAMVFRINHPGYEVLEWKAVPIE